MAGAHCKLCSRRYGSTAHRAAAPKSWTPPKPDSRMHAVCDYCFLWRAHYRKNHKRGNLKLIPTDSYPNLAALRVWVVGFADSKFLSEIADETSQRTVGESLLRGLSCPWKAIKVFCALNGCEACQDKNMFGSINYEALVKEYRDWSEGESGKKAVEVAVEAEKDAKKAAVEAERVAKKVAAEMQERTLKEKKEKGVKETREFITLARTRCDQMWEGVAEDVKNPDPDPKIIRRKIESVLSEIASEALAHVDADADDANRRLVLSFAELGRSLYNLT